MIEFSGTPTGQCRELGLKMAALTGFIGSMMTSILFLIPVVIVSIVWNWIVIIFVLPLILFVVLASRRPGEKEYDSIFPTTVLIDGTTITSASKKFCHTRPLSDVKKVIDRGEWYDIVLKFPRNSRFVCQKDLITEGTLADFESLFADKIVRKP